MSRFILFIAGLLLALVAADISAQTKKGSAPTKSAGAPQGPTASDSSDGVYRYMSDSAGNKILVSTQVWDKYPDYDAGSLQRFFAVTKALETHGFTRNDSIANTWTARERKAKCTIDLDTKEAGMKKGMGAVVGCEANGVSSLAAPTSSTDPKHIDDVIELFNKQFARAKESASR